MLCSVQTVQMDEMLVAILVKVHQVNERLLHRLELSFEDSLRVASRLEHLEVPLVIENQHLDPPAQLLDLVQRKVLACLQLLRWHPEKVCRLLPRGHFGHGGAQSDLSSGDTHHIGSVLLSVHVVESVLHHALAQLVHCRITWSAHQNSWLRGQLLEHPLALLKLARFPELCVEEAVAQLPRVRPAQAAARPPELLRFHGVRDGAVVSLEAHQVDHVEDAPDSVCFSGPRGAMHESESVSLLSGIRTVVSAGADRLVLPHVKLVFQKLLELLPRALWRQGSPGFLWCCSSAEYGPRADLTLPSQYRLQQRESLQLAQCEELPLNRHEVTAISEPDLALLQLLLNVLEDLQRHQLCEIIIPVPPRVRPLQALYPARIARTARPLVPIHQNQHVPCDEIFPSHVVLKIFHLHELRAILLIHRRRQHPLVHIPILTLLLPVGDQAGPGLFQKKRPVTLEVVSVGGERDRQLN
mmetsp:Transcript_4921/g.8753  ORF Transcript_4921/g.8753 Transcript_4921/m.8753 type:complete len:469 (+) Transcript_4921:1180-2586(+)